MKDKKIHIAASPLTGTIFAGKVLKSGVWASGKQDVTIEALIAVSEHAIKFGKPVVISNEDGKPLFEISVSNLS